MAMDKIEVVFKTVNQLFWSLLLSGILLVILGILIAIFPTLLIVLVTILFIVLGIIAIVTAAKIHKYTRLVIKL